MQKETFKNYLTFIYSIIYCNFRRLFYFLSKVVNSFKFKIAPSEKTYVVKFNTVENVYKYGSERSISNIDQIKTWGSGAYSYSNIQLKIEYDWKMCYLARTQGSSQAHIEWYFDLSECSTSARNLTKLELKCDYACYESGEVKLFVYSMQDESETGNKLALERGCGARNGDLSFEAMAGDFYTIHFNHKNLKGLKLRVEMTKGNGDNAWQHTQLFRQSLSDTQSCLLTARFYFD
jgi:peptide-N4-(N-acetyl-beta-glucosaminyl)asparagine amidase